MICRSFCRGVRLFFFTSDNKWTNGYLEKSDIVFEFKEQRKIKAQHIGYM
jgi:hypothetical protein